MYTKELISWDPLAGIAQYHWYDVDTDTSVFESVGDAGPVIEANKKLQNEPQIWKNGMKNDFVLYASIDPITQLKWLSEDGINVWKKEDGHRISKKLEDPDYRYLKCTTHKHIIKAHD